MVSARTQILATGVTWRRLAVAGLDRLIGKGVFHGATRAEVAATHGLDVHLVGAGNSAGQAALNCANHARRVTLVVRGASLGKTMSRYLVEKLQQRPNVDVKLASEVLAVHGERPISATPNPTKLAGTTAAACSSSSAPMPRRDGCPQRSRAMRADTS